MNLNYFIEDLSSEKPTPGGGSTSALFGVLGCALDSMVCALTYNKKKYEEHQTFVRDCHNQILSLQNDLEDLIEQDMLAYSQLNGAYRLPKNTEEQKIYREKQIQSNLRPAAEVPFSIMKLCAQGIKITQTLIGKTNKLAISDLACSVVGFKAAIECAWVNVKINLSLSKVPMDDIKQKCQDILSKYPKLAEEIYSQIETNL